MNDDLFVSKIKLKCWNAFSTMTRLHDACESLSASPSQEKIDEIASLAAAYKEANEELQFSFMDFLKNAIEPSEEIQITSKESDIGYKIN